MTDLNENSKFELKHRIRSWTKTDCPFLTLYTQFWTLTDRRGSAAVLNVNRVVH